jgi:hypothetical protein
MEHSDDEGVFVFPFEKIEVWQLSVDLADFVFGLLESTTTRKAGGLDFTAIGGKRQGR